MVSGEEKIVPESFENMNLEWMWRLRTNTWARLKDYWLQDIILF